MIEFADILRLARSTEIVMLVIGAKQERISCHSALLGAYSGFFDAALFGPQSKLRSGSMELRKEQPHEIQQVVQWIYTGRLLPDENVRLESLWVLADKLVMYHLADDIMQQIFIFNVDNPLLATSVRYIYANTVPGSLLREYVAAEIRADGPLHPENLRCGSELQQWKEPITEGGDLLADQIDTGMFSRFYDVDVMHEPPRDEPVSYLFVMPSIDAKLYRLNQIEARSCSTTNPATAVVVYEE